MYKLKVDPDFIDQRNAEMAQNGKFAGWASVIIRHMNAGGRGQDLCTLQRLGSNGQVVVTINQS